ncbi:Hypothetical protein Cp267_0207 [Corynebacterium pseudotuberculosis 267]|nr:Hypothetical protein Cp267_0207 [Corynebacterium pseudotuberculosis 267]ANK55597.1 Hypothetical protein CpPA02_0181 [Corynebacterium pseudotuberculosis]
MTEKRSLYQSIKEIASCSRGRPRLCSEKQIPASTSRSFNATLHSLRMIGFGYFMIYF